MNLKVCLPQMIKPTPKKMKPNYFLFLIFTTLFISCSKNSITPEFIKQAEGRYLYNPDETIEIYFENNKLLMKWRGADKIEPLKLDNNIYFIKEMNEKIQFLVNPSNGDKYISLISKEKKAPITYDFKKLKKGLLLPSEYLKNNQFEKALIGYKSILEKDSLSPFVKQSHFNSLGYRHIRDNNLKMAISVFRINVALFPKSSNVYDSLGEAFLKNGDTIQSIENYKKALELDSGNRRAQRKIKALEKKND